MEQIVISKALKAKALAQANTEVRQKYASWKSFVEDKKFLTVTHHYLSQMRVEPFGSHLRYKRSPYDRLSELGNLNGSYFIGEYTKILAKSSEQPASVRSFISGVIERCANILFEKRVRQEYMRILADEAKNKVSDEAKRESK